MKIKKLPAEVRSKLQSGMLITDAVQCVLELVHNSLDAEATGIAVRVDLKNYQIRVIDNGKGIGKDDLEFVGEKFMTSKYQPMFEREAASFCTYGFKGQAISSLRDVSRSLTIETKSENNGPTFVKVFHNNNALPITENDSNGKGTGTTITVDDFMYLMPVRRKRISQVFDMEEIKNQLQYLAIIHYNVCFTLRNETKGLILLQTSQASNILESVKNVYGKTVAKSLKTLHYKENKYEISGFISLKPQAQGNIQLLFINKRFVSKCVIHKFVNTLIKKYCGKENLFGDSPTGRILRRLKSSYNVYIIQITCPCSYYEFFTSIRKVTVEFKNWKEALKCIHKAVKKSLKGVLNTESSSNSHCNENKNEEGSDRGKRGVFGTSLLVNAVRGAAAKRDIGIKGDRSKKKTQKINKKQSNLLLSKMTKNPSGCGETDNQAGTDRSLNTTVHKNVCSNDTMESPIPKSAFKKVNQICGSKNKAPDFSKSFIEFYEWLKTKFETDAQAFNLYNDFLQFKNKTIHSPEDTKFRSPVVGGKLKRKQPPIMKQKNLEKKPKTSSNDLDFLNKEIAIVTQRQLKIFPNQHLRMKKAVQFSAEMRSDIHETLNFSYRRGKNDNFKMPSDQLFMKPGCLSVSKTKEKQFEYNQTLQSLPSSEVQFTNIMKFRNLSDSFFHNFSNSHVVPEKTFSATNTWVSHHQESRNMNLYEMNCNRNFVSWMKATESETQHGMGLDDFDYSNAHDTKLHEFANKRSRIYVQDVEVQVNISTFSAKKVNAMVQTFREVPESPSFENSFVFTQRGATENKRNHEEEQKTELSEGSFSQEVPNNDFWNSTSHMLLEGISQQMVVYDDIEMTTNKTSDDVENKKNLTSNEFVCGHKSQVSTKVESLSKETQTLAAIWTDSLTNIGYPFENVNPESVNNAKSKTSQTSDPNTVPKTIPIEEINCDAETGFCMSERHDFVPKGLSPKFLKPDPATVASLSPSEKCRIKITVENTQNEFLANIKWQNEFTGDCVKPTIPEGIIFEMHRKAGENLMHYENPVLSATLSYCAIKVHNLLHSFAFTKELLSGVEVLGQLDKKFIVTKMKISTPKKMQLISLFDQHAVDERIKLEELIEDNITADGKLVSSRLNPPVECTVTESVFRIVSDLKEKLYNLGLNAEPINDNTLSVYKVPSFLLKKHEHDLKNKKENSLSDAVRALILNVIEEVTETRGAVSKIPKVMHNAFCLEACHKAIKFNKQLSSENMIEMITKLQSCKLPFQCAHGRPSVIPIIDLKDFEPTMEENETVALEKLKKFLSERKEDSVIENSKTTQLNK